MVFFFFFFFFLTLLARSRHFAVDPAMESCACPKVAFGLFVDFFLENFLFCFFDHEKKIGDIGRQVRQEPHLFKNIIDRKV
jgi:hypothetical protein